MHIMPTNIAKTLVWKHEYNVKLWRHKHHTSNKNDHHIATEWNPPPWKFSAYATAACKQTYWMIAVIFCTETSRHVNYSVSNQHWTSSIKPLQWIQCAEQIYIQMLNLSVERMN